MSDVSDDTAKKSLLQSLRRSAVWIRGEAETAERNWAMLMLYPSLQQPAGGSRVEAGTAECNWAKAFLPVIVELLYAQATQSEEWQLQRRWIKTPGSSKDIGAPPPLGPALQTIVVDVLNSDELPVVPDDKKGWIKGPALEFLMTNHLLHYLELYEDSPAQAKEYADTACNDLHMHFDFRLPMNVPPEKPYDPKEALSKRDQLLRTVESMKAHGSKKAKAVTAKNGADAMDILLGRVNGIEPGTLKGMAPYQLWAKEEGEEACKLFREAFKASGDPTCLHAGQEAAHMSSLFAALPKETQDSYKARVAEDKVKAQEERDRVRGLMEQPLPPQEAQKLVATLSGMKIMMVMGGAEPRRGGKLNMLVQNHRKDKSAIPVKFCGNVGRYGHALEAFREFLAECYDKEDERARALPGSEESMEAAESSGKIPYEEVDILKGLLQLDEETFSDDDEADIPDMPKKGTKEPQGENAQKGKRKKRADDKNEPSKKKKKTMTKTADGGQANFTETSAGSRGKKKKNTVSKKAVIGIGESLAKLSGAAGPSTPQGPASSRNVVGQSPFASIRASPQTKKVAQVVQTPVPLRMHRQAPTPSSAAIDPALKGNAPGNASLASPLAGRSARNRVESLPPSPMQSISFGQIPIFSPNDMLNPFDSTSVMLPVPRRKPTLSPADAACLEDEKWPPWFKKARDALQSPLLSSLGDGWDDIMWFWTLIEGRQEFKTSRNSIGPQAAELRPAEVGDWLKRGRNVEYVPELGRKDVKVLGESWWAWWKALQPEWRDISGVEGCLEGDHQTGNSDWDCLWHLGANGLMTVLIGLKWWGLLITKHYGMGSMRMRNWEAAVEDILWVMTSMDREAMVDTASLATDKMAFRGWIRSVTPEKGWIRSVTSETKREVTRHVSRYCLCGYIEIGVVQVLQIGNREMGIEIGQDFGLQEKLQRTVSRESGTSLHCGHGHRWSRQRWDWSEESNRKEKMMRLVLGSLIWRQAIGANWLEKKWWRDRNKKTASHTPVQRWNRCQKGSGDEHRIGGGQVISRVWEWERAKLPDWETSKAVHQDGEMPSVQLSSDWSICHQLRTLPVIEPIDNWGIQESSEMYGQHFHPVKKPFFGDEFVVAETIGRTGPHLGTPGSSASAGPWEVLGTGDALCRVSQIWKAKEVLTKGGRKPGFGDGHGCAQPQSGKCEGDLQA
ncbi:hypothetical protein EV421DRAFT_1739211 [Armillaria borealis]|uniref:Rhodanese domain-containing protein n=1 Tax=Armillaria borealis TaxID=47425 RepID=A0AA39JA78_9AGAR|nr:hypothetical protein EV421DRAFT_1739211 [Armillaria borealis]